MISVEGRPATCFTGYASLSSESKPDGSEVSGSATGFGGIGVLGGEWYAIDRMSFYAEYGLQLMSWKTSREYTRVRIDSDRVSLCPE